MALERVSRPLLALPRLFKRLIVIAVDIALCALTVWLAYYLRLGNWISLTGRPSFAVFLSIAIALPIFATAGLYRIVLRYVDAKLITLVAASCIFYGILYAALISAYAFTDIPRTVGLIQPILLFMAVSCSRVVASWLLTNRVAFGARHRDRARVLIYGAGSSGRQLARAASESNDMIVVGFVDDDSSLQGRMVLGRRIFSPSKLKDLVEARDATDILLALPSASRRRRNEIIAHLQQFPIHVRTLPGLIDLAHGRVHTSDLRELTIEDLLGRDPVEPEYDSIRSKIADGIVLVTGAGGSIGSELCRQIVKVHPTKLLLVESNEYALYAIHLELQRYGAVDLVPLLGSVNDQIRMGEILEVWRPAMVFHAAAYKHVPIVEHNVLEGIRNNVLGTMQMAELSVAHGVGNFVLISTDKAVRPTNVMGASKRLAELSLQAMAAQYPSTCMSMVRFGNVLGSSGSVVPLFREQIRSGGPITITHHDITRYFMTIPEAAQLVVQASAMARGGEVFVLEMGDPVRIYDLALNLIRLSGLTVRDEDHPNGDIEIVTVGLRPGEKLYEELLIGNNPLATSHPRVMMAAEPYMSLEALRPKLDLMRSFIEKGDVLGARNLLCELVPEYVPESAVVDFVNVARSRP